MGMKDRSFAYCIKFCIRAVVLKDESEETLAKLRELLSDDMKTPITHLPMSDWAKAALLKLGKGEAEWLEDEIGVGYLLGLYDAYDSMYQEGELDFDLNDLENLRDIK